MRTWILLVSALASANVCRGLEIDFGYNANRHNMFTSGFSSNPVRNGNILGMPGLDFSGVGWGAGGESQKNVAMITPQHFVLADHFRLPVGSSVVFLNREGQLKTYTINRYYTTTFTAGSQSDLTIGEFTTAILPSDLIRTYDVVLSNDYSYYQGKQIATVGRNVGGATEGALGGKVGLDTIEEVVGYNFGSSATDTVGYYWQSFANTNDVTRLVGGDSGSPSFLLYGGRLTILGTNSGIITSQNPQLNVATFMPFYIDQINSLISSTGFQLTVVQVPEPSTVLLISLAAAAGVALRRRRKRVN